MESRVSDLVREYTAFASGLVEQWSALASKSASKIDAGTYTATSAAEDAAAGATLAAKEGWSWAELTWQAVAGLLGLEGLPARSETFYAPEGAKLKLSEEYPIIGPRDATPPGITIHPEQLGPGKTEFTLCTGEEACSGGTYVVVVEATPADGEPVMVVAWITVL